MKYNSKEQLVIEFKKLLLDKQISQREVAEKLNITSQALTKILNKQNFSFDDMQKLLSVVGYQMIVDFIPSKEITEQSTTLPVQQEETTPEPQQPNSQPTPKRQIISLTPDAEEKINLDLLLHDITYQLTVRDSFGDDGLRQLLEKAHTKAQKETSEETLEE